LTKRERIKLKRITNQLHDCMPAGLDDENLDFFKAVHELLKFSQKKTKVLKPRADKIV
jgi:hypothetical protein